MHGYDEDKAKVIARLRRIEGQVRAITQMVEDDKYCIDILTQISASNSALKSVPNFCDGVLLLPADMPNITPQFINKMIKQFDKKTEKQVVTAALNGVKSNPVIWSRSLYDVADLVPENAELRPVLIEHSDYTKTVKGDEYILLDVNYPNDLEQLNK